MLVTNQTHGRRFFKEDLDKGMWKETNQLGLVKVSIGIQEMRRMRARELAYKPPWPKNRVGKAEREVTKGQ